METMEIEKLNLKDIPGYNGVYRVSDCGKVVSYKRKFSKTPIVLKQCKVSGGYPGVCLNHYGIAKVCRVHTLVARAFLGERPKGLVIDHVDGNKENNNVSNLEYVSHKTNIKRAWKMGLASRKRGSANSYAKLKEKDIPEIREMLKRGVVMRVIAEKFGVKISTIKNVKYGSTWAHVR